MDLGTIVAIVVLVLFAIVYFILFGLLCSSERKIIFGKLRDETIEREIYEDYDAYLSGSGGETFIAYHLKRKKRKEGGSVFTAILTWLVCIFCIVLLVFSLVVRSSGNQLFFGDTAILVVKTASMEEKNDANLYLEENDLDDQIPGGSLITITKNYEIELYHIYAFKSLDETTTYVHRLVMIREDDDGNPTYVFRGDANNGSMPEEMNVTPDRIIGEYTGYNNAVLGQFMLYFQSGIGIIALAVAVMVLVGFYVCEDIKDRAYEERYQTLAEKPMGIFLKWDKRIEQEQLDQKLLKNLDVSEDSKKRKKK